MTLLYILIVAKVPCIDMSEKEESLILGGAVDCCLEKLISRHFWRDIVIIDFQIFLQILVQN